MTGDEPMSEVDARALIEDQARRIAGVSDQRDVDLLDVGDVVLPNDGTYLVAEFTSHLVVAFRGVSLPQLAAAMVLAQPDD